VSLTPYLESRQLQVVNAKARIKLLPVEKKNQEGKVFLYQRLGTANLAVKYDSKTQKKRDPTTAPGGDV